MADRPKYAVDPQTAQQPKKEGLTIGVAGESRNQNQAVITTTQPTTTTPKGTNAGLGIAKQDLTIQQPAQTAPSAAN